MMGLGAGLTPVGRAQAGSIPSWSVGSDSHARTSAGSPLKHASGSVVDRAPEPSFADD